MTPVSYPPWERALDRGREAVGFYGFDPLSGTGPLLPSYAAAMAAVAASVTAALSAVLVDPS